MARNQLDSQRIDTLRINAIGGLNRNSAKAAHNYEAKASLQPQVLHNLSKINRRGFTPIGLPVDSTIDFTGEVIGQDQFGVVSLKNTGLYYLTDLTGAPVAQEADPYTSLDNTTHVPNVGIYKNRNQFMVYDRDGNIVEPFDFGITASLIQQAEPLIEDISSSGITYSEGMEYFAAFDEWWLFGRNGEIFYSDDDFATWNDVSISLGEDINAIATDGTNIMAVSPNNTIYFSDDHGSTWSTINPTPSVADNAEFNSVIWDGSRFIIVGSFGFAYQSTDGATYTQISPDGVDAFTDIAFANSTYYISEAGYGSEQVFRRTTTVSFPTLTRVGTGRQAKIYSIASNGTTWVAVGTNEAGTGIAILVSNDATNWTIYSETILSDGESGWTPRSVEYSSGWFVMCGVGYIYKSTNGTNWIRVAIPATASTAHKNITVGSDGNFYIVTAGASPEVLLLDVANSLVPGKYQVLAVPHIVTKSGKLVLDLLRYDFTTIEDGSIDVSVEPDADPNHANFNVDIYIKLARYTIDAGEITATENFSDKDFVYIDTLAESESLSFDEYPDAATEIIGARGAIGICAFGSNAICNYNGYFWGRLSEDAADYKFLEDNINVGDIALPLVAGFSERNYINLFTINNTRPLGSSVSDDITGCAISSQGLVVFCDNEAFYIRGDPEDNLTTNILPDYVGLDSGKQAVNFSGIPVTIHKGRIYLIDQGRARDVSEEMYQFYDPFVQVVVDPETKSIIARTSDNSVFRLDLDDEGVWTNDVIRESDRLFQKIDTVYYMNQTGDLFTVTTTLNTMSSPYVPKIGFKDMDFANPYRRDKIKTIGVPVKNFSLDEDNRPRMYYRCVPSMFDIENASAAYVEGYMKDRFVYFKIPNRFKGERWDFMLELRNATNQTIIEDAWLIRIGAGEEAAY